MSIIHFQPTASSKLRSTSVHIMNVICIIYRREFRQYEIIHMDVKRDKLNLSGRHSDSNINVLN